MSVTVGVVLSRDVFSSDADLLFTELQAWKADFESRCSCPEGVWCEVTLVESERGLYDLIAVRPGYGAATPENWIAIPREDETRYVRSFADPSAVELATAILQIVSIPLLVLL
jgi:hypothetical protein